MALKRNERYPGRFGNPNAAHPQGAFKNRTSPTSQDGSYLESDWANDWDGFFARLLTVAGVTANGNVDTGTSSQYYDALVAAIKSTLGTAAQRNVGTGTNQLPDMSAFSKGSGYFKLPNGKIIQFFQGTTITTAAVQINYPIPFPAGATFVLATPIDVNVPNWIAANIFQPASCLVSAWQSNGTRAATNAMIFAIGE